MGALQRSSRMLHEAPQGLLVHKSCPRVFCEVPVRAVSVGSFFGAVHSSYGYFMKIPWGRSSGKHA